MTLPARPITIDLDPEFMTFRRIARQSLSPVLNHYVTDRRRSVLTGFTDEQDHPSPFRDVVARIETQERQKPIGERTMIVSLASGRAVASGRFGVSIGRPGIPFGGSIDHGPALW